MIYYFTRYSWLYPKVLIYMLQDVEYRPGRYLAWYYRTDHFGWVMRRRTLDMTRKAQLLLAIVWAIELAIDAAIIILVVVGAGPAGWGWWLGAGLLLLAKPWLTAHLILVPLVVGRVLIQAPKEWQIVRQARGVLAGHPAIRIAVAGSYGKTTAKEILKTVLGEGRRVAATPGNMNTLIGISRFAHRLKGNEEILIIELGEEKPGDVARLARLARPDIGVITGINEAHLVSFKTLDQTVQTIYELADYVPADKLYQNMESPLVADAGRDGIGFDRKSVNGWKITGIKTGIEGTSFSMKRGEQVIQAKTGLIGEHTVGVTAVAAAIAYDLGLTVKQIQAGLKKVVPFEHRMQPRQLHGAWIIDDTYNGNSEGVQAGLAFLGNVEARRRVYVTPGLVEQGDQTQTVHENIGRAIVGTADVVVLMKNSVTEYIKSGLAAKKFAGQLIEVDDPLEFYTHLDKFVAAGDVVLMQNDWTDNYR